jgi:hypothetical protein
MGKIVNSHHVEYGYELLSVLPYAYNRHVSGDLSETISGIDTKCLYYFSPKHTEVSDRRAFLNIHTAKHYGIPNTVIHAPELDWDKWTPPPLKEHYKDKAITFNKPTICICNRYTKEWNKEPVNFLSVDILGKLFDSLKDKYQIVYVSIAGKTAYYDDSDEIDQQDYDFIYQNYDGSEVKIIHDIQEEHQITFNESVLRVFAGCERFITMNGGFGILASYFGGENIIYCKQSTDLIFNDFGRWYWRIGGSEITHVNSYDDLLYMVNRLYIKEDKPMTYFIHDERHLRDNIRDCLSKDRFSRVVIKTHNDKPHQLCKKFNCISSQYTDLMKQVYKKHTTI